MSIYSTTTIVKWNQRIKKYYVGKGYSFTEYGDEFNVKIEDLKKGSHSLIEVLCDYCKINTFFKEYKTYNEQKDKAINKKDSCKECMNLKRKEVAVKHHKMDFNIIKRHFDDKGMILISEESDYENDQSTLYYSCPIHAGSGTKSTNWHDFKTYTHGCKECGLEASRQFSLNNYDKVYGNRFLPFAHNIEVAKRDSENKGLILISNEYSGVHESLEFICPKHEDEGVQTTTLHSVRNTNVKNHCFYCHIQAISGENAHNWRGGITTERKLTRESWRVKEWREEVFKRDEYTCQACGDNSGGNLNAHHIVNYAENEELRNDVDNGITLCGSCHLPHIEGSFHFIYGTTNNTKEQLYEYINHKKQVNQKPLKIQRGRSSRCKFTDEEVLTIRNRLKNKERTIDLAKEYGCGVYIIFNIKSGKTYQHVTNGEPLTKINKRSIRYHGL